MALELLSIIPCDAPIPPDDGVPLTFTQVVATYEGRILLIHNRSRPFGQWELPGGGMEPGETVADCAARELLEESGQIAETLTIKALFQIRMLPEDRLEYGAVYAATLTEVRPFVTNEEVDRILLWDGVDALDDRLGSLVTEFMAYCNG